MKLIRFGNRKRKPGVQLDNGQKLDISAFGSDYDEKFLVRRGQKD